MQKSTSLCEFSTTPSVSLMKDKRGHNLGAAAQQQSQSPPPKAEKAPAKKEPQQEEEDMFAME